MLAWSQGSASATRQIRTLKRLWNGLPDSGWMFLQSPHEECSMKPNHNYTSLLKVPLESPNSVTLYYVEAAYPRMSPLLGHMLKMKFPECISQRREENTCKVLKTKYIQQKLKSMLCLASRLEHTLFPLAYIPFLISSTFSRDCTARAFQIHWIHLPLPIVWCFGVSLSPSAKFPALLFCLPVKIPNPLRLATLCGFSVSICSVLRALKNVCGLHG